jgi:protein Tex
MNSDPNLKEPNYPQIIAQNLSLTPSQVNNTLTLIEKDNNTIHFIARYRKEKTSNLDETQLRQIIDLKTSLQKLHNYKLLALKNIDEQSKLTPSLKSEILNAKSLTQVEDLYSPYKRKKKTNADLAKEKGFDVIATQILNQEKINIPSHLTNKFSKDEILTGAINIISQDISDNAKLKDILRKFYFQQGILTSTINPTLDEEQLKIKHKFEIYSQFNMKVTKIKGYQTLALNRGENLKILKIKLTKDKLHLEKFIKELSKIPCSSELTQAITTGYNKLFLSIERELRNSLTESASLEAIELFQNNLKGLLMLKPHYNEKVLAIDPGFRTGCKMAVINKNNQPIDFSKAYLHNSKEFKRIIPYLVSKHSINTIVIGNGTASKETKDLILELNLSQPIVIVNESGASVYSTSEIGNKEFPNLDATDRGTISIGRRYIDCLSEIVKVPVISIGVGMYQHDMNQKQLEIKLKHAVEDIVNLVGINLNTASEYLLSYVSGITFTTAKKIVANAPYKGRQELTKFLTPKTYQQCVGFLRCNESKCDYDKTSIHPEQYELANLILKNPSLNFTKLKPQLEKIYPEITTEIYNDIKQAYQNRGKELRKFDGNLAEKSHFLTDLKQDQIITGIVRNIMPFGAFVDIGLKNNAFIHISQIADQFIKDPSQFLSIGESITAKILEIDPEKNRVSLTLKGM